MRPRYEMKLVLFDIDGTLLICGKAPRMAITYAMERVFGTSGRALNHSFSGKTDPQIITELMTMEGRGAEEIAEGMPRVVRHYVEELDRTLQPAEIRRLNGVTELLAALRIRTDVHLGILTGNVEEGARIKLDRAGLAEIFFNNGSTVGAFGSDAIHRSELPAVAVQRARHVLNHEFRSKDIIIIGDSPNDILCGKSLNVRSVAVATGWHSMEELKACEPDFAFPTLAGTQEIVNAIVSN